MRKGYFWGVDQIRTSSPAPRSSSSTTRIISASGAGLPVQISNCMCGVPHHSAEGYIARLIQKGYRVALCEQMEDPRFAKKLVKRGTAHHHARHRHRIEPAAFAREQLPGRRAARRESRRPRSRVEAAGRSRGRDLPQRAAIWQCRLQQFSD